METILILANYFDGLYIFRKKLIYELSKDYKIICCVPFDEKYKSFKNENIDFIFVDLNRRGKNIFQEIKLLFFYLRIIKRVKPIKIITYTIKPNIYGGIAARFLGVNYYCNITGLGSAFQGKKSSRIMTVLYRFALLKCKYVFFENEENKDIFIINNIITEQKAILLDGAGVDLDEFRITPFPRDKETVFLFIGRAMVEKGYVEFAEAAKKVAKEKSIRFIAIGDVEDEFKPTFNTIQNEGLIQHYGKVDNPKDYITKASCVVLPSYHEGMSNALLEAGAMGRPIITTNIHGCKETVIDTVSGFLVEKKDANDLVNKVIQFCNLPWSEKNKMAEHSFMYVSKRFDKEKVVRKTIEFLNK